LGVQYLRSRKLDIEVALLRDDGGLDRMAVIEMKRNM
jgi:hypothetical protein